MVSTAERENGVWVPGFDTFEEEGPPSVEELLALRADYTEYFRAFHDACAKVDQYYYGQNPVPSPEGFDAVRTARARSIINVATDHVDVTNVAIDVPLASPRAKARAERLKKFYQGTWAAIKSPVKRTAARHAFAYGIGWLKVMFDTDKWPDAPRMDDFDSTQEYRDALDDFMDKRSIAFPLAVDNVNPRRLIWDDSRVGGGPRWAMETYRRTDLRDLRRRYPQWVPEAETQFTEWTEYWDDTHFVYMADDQIVDSGKHGYNFVPYVPIIPSNTMDWDDRPPHERYQGLLHPIYDLLDEHARIMTAYSAILRAFAWPTLDFSGPPHLVEQAKNAYELFGGLNTLPTGVEVGASPRPAPPPELLQQLNVLETQMEEATFPNVIRGMRPRGVSAGFAISVLAGMGRLVFQGVADGMARAVEECNSRFAKLVENKVQGRITVHARTDIHNFDQSIGPDDIRGYHENIATLKAESPEEREREALLAFRLWNGGNGLISQYEAQRRAGVINPLEMQIDQTAERLMQSPTFQAALEQLAAQRVGLLEQAADLLGTDTGGLGSQNMGLASLQRPGEGDIQRQRVASQQGAPSPGNPAVFPRGLGDLGLLGANIGGAPGGTQGMPSGQQV